VKKALLSLTILGFGLTSFAYASDAVSTIPTPTSGFSVNLTGLYLQPGANNLNYAVYTHPLPITTPNWSQVSVKPGYTPALNLGLQYNFADPMNKANIDWLYLSSNSTNSFSSYGVNASVAPPYYFGPLAQALVGTNATSKVQIQLDNIAMTLGHLINLGLKIQVDPFAGISGTYLKEDITSTYMGNDSSANPYTVTSYNTSKFTGIGPRFGMNGSFFITNRFAVSARIAASLFAGTMRTYTNFSSFGAGNHVAAYTVLANQSQNRVVPEVDSKLEVSYLIPMRGGKSNLTLAAGYLFSAYVNGITQVVPTALVPGAFNGGTLAVETAGQTQSDLDLNGPYASLIWKF